MTPSYSVLAVADSESYVKWAARLLDGLPDADARLVIVDSPIRPTADQIRAAVAGTRWADDLPPIRERRSLRSLLEATRPDILLAAATGPVVEQVYATAAGMERRPALVSGLPGVGLPATLRGALHRRFGDAFITHSHHEAQAYAQVYTRRRIPAQILVSRLPLLSSAGPPQQSTAADQVTRLVFAPQAKVPVEPEDRVAILLALDAWVRQDPERTAVVKLRSREGEHETHHERHRYRDLLAGLRAEGRVSERVVEDFGPLSDFLTPGSALVTVSSTAALESLDHGLPTLIISDFGVDERMLNVAFAESGLDRPLAQMVAGDLPFPTARWLADNYFHPLDDRFADDLRLLAARAREDQLPRIAWPSARLGLRRLRAEARAAAPAWVVTAYRRITAPSHLARRHP
ncbi:DUF6716 putative glycosyltransferase [Brevibacterium senegalense]|uniref:DUF6716 putative glycosyltransferase n=1 Tax=Brevibacterium senegalense TaxID=1033736 RepID=UPI0002E0AB32|nr:DUF6716 putative glycosyltransferase [Brevibacterium senegalense]